MTDETQAPDAAEAAVESDQPQVSETPEPPAPESDGFFSEKFDPSTLAPELQARYKEMQGAFTTKTQSLAEERKNFADKAQFYDNLESDPDFQKTVARQLLEWNELDPSQVDGLLDDIDELEDDGDGSPELSQLKKQLEDVQAKLEADDHSKLVDTFRKSIDTQLASIIKDERGGKAFSEQATELIKRTAANMPLDDKGEPDIKGAYAQFNGALDAEKQAWIGSKGGPAVPPSGASAVQDLDILDRKARLAHMESVARAAMGEDAA
jgi:hypothetical protein